MNSTSAEEHPELLAQSLEERLKQLSRRVEELEDKQALASLLNRYVRTVDSFDWEAWGECWTEDAVADFGPYGKVERREAILKASREAQAIYQHRGGMQHVLANLELEVDGDTAVGLCNLLLAVTLNSAKAPPDYAFGGKYRWTFARTGAGWQIERAELTTAWAAGPDIAGVYT
jgi:hypothetical protein